MENQFNNINEDLLSINKNFYWYPILPYEFNMMLNNRERVDADY